jgi:hypothetical protein
MPNEVLVPLEELRQNLIDLVPEMLHELSWHNNYPLDPGVAITGFIEAWQPIGEARDDEPVADVSVNGYEVKVALERGGISGEVTLSPTDVLRGWDQNPFICPKSCYDAICIVYDRIGEDLTGKDKSEWFKRRHTESRIIRQRMENRWLPYFDEHQEHVLLHRDGHSEPLLQPQLINQVLSEFPLEVLQRAREFRASGGPAMEGILYDVAEERIPIERVSWNDYDHEYHPSESTMIQWFEGLYFWRLGQLKGYIERDAEPHELFFRGRDGLPQGRELWPQDE